MEDRGIKELYRMSGILERWHDKTFDEFINDPDALTKISNYLTNIKSLKEQGVGIMLYGANGTGKSHLLNCLFKELLAKRYKVRIVSFSSFVQTFADGWYDDNVKQTFRSIKHCDFLGIEEIGKEMKASSYDEGGKKTYKPTELTISVLDSVLRYRLQSNKPTIITSNNTPTELLNYYNIDIVSMLKESCVPVQVKGKDYRDVIKTKIKGLI